METFNLEITSGIFYKTLKYENNQGEIIQNRVYGEKTAKFIDFFNSLGQLFSRGSMSQPKLVKLNMGTKSVYMSKQVFEDFIKNCKKTNLS